MKKKASISFPSFIFFIFLFNALWPLSFTFGRNLEYEYILASGLSLVLSILLAGPFLPFHRFSRTVGESFVQFLICTLGFLCIPLCFFLLGFCQCSIYGFRFWGVFLWTPYFLFTWFLLLLYKRLNEFSFIRIWSFLSSLLFLASGFAILTILWFAPQKRMSHPFFGFFHGPIYDQYIAIDTALVFKQCEYALWFLLFIFLLLRFKQKLIQLALCSCILAGACAITVKNLKNSSTKHGINNLKKNFNGEYTSAAFSAYYVKGANNENSNAERLIKEAQFHITELNKIFGEKTPYVHIFIYPNEFSKKTWFGGGATDVADVVTPSIHINETGFPHPTLRHELVHALASDMAFHGLGFHPNMALTEGLAIALSSEADSVDMDTSTGYILSQKKDFNVDNLFSPLFWKESQSQAYTVAGSLLRYLIRNVGFAPVAKLYRGESWKDALSIKSDIILKDWRTHCVKKYEEQKENLLIASLFRHPGVLAAKCPHTKTDYARSAENDFWLKYRQPPRWKASEDYWPWRLKLDPSDQYAHYQNARREVTPLIVKQDISALKTKAETYMSAHPLPPKTIEDVDFLILASDIYFAIQDIEKSEIILTELIALVESKEKSFGEDLYRQLMARRWLRGMFSPEVHAYWRLYLAGWQQLPEFNPWNYQWFELYLRMRRGDTGVLKYLEPQDMLKKSVPAMFQNTDFAKEFYKMVGANAILKKDYETAAQAFDLAKSSAPEGMQDWFEEQRRLALSMRTE